ncbi:MAG: type II toxin-antitoxin system RelE/ParE family toxin [Flavobacterium sp.]
MRTVVWSNNSIESIQNIYNYISFQSPQNAEMVVDTLFRIGDELSVFPKKNPIEPIFKSEKIRFLPKWNFKIVYKIEIDRIIILDVFSTRQNLSL